MPKKKEGALSLPEQLETMKRLNFMRKKEHVSEPSEIEKSKQAKEDCSDGEHYEFKQMYEKELLSHLRDGWAIAHRLSDGELIVMASFFFGAGVRYGVSTSAVS